MSGIFISYRRRDTDYIAGRLHDCLAPHFGREQIFRDIDTIAPGVDFVDRIEDAVGSCAALIAVIGDHWLNGTDAKGRRRLDNPRDWVRLEITAALKRRILVVPVLVEGASMPLREELPQSLRRLARFNALEMTDSRWEYEADRLIRALKEAVSPPGPGSRPRLLRGERTTGPRDRPFPPGVTPTVPKERPRPAEKPTPPARPSPVPRFETPTPPPVPSLPRPAGQTRRPPTAPSPTPPRRRSPPVPPAAPTLRAPADASPGTDRPATRAEQPATPSQTRPWATGGWGPYSSTPPPPASTRNGPSDAPPRPPSPPSPAVDDPGLPRFVKIGIPAAVAALLVVILAVVLTRGNGERKAPPKPAPPKSEPSPTVTTKANQTSTTKGTSQVTRPPPPVSTTVPQDVTHVANILLESNVRRREFDKAVTSIETCDLKLTPTQKSQALDAAVSDRQHILGVAEAIAFDNIPNGARLRDELNKALTASVETGHAYQTWAAAYFSATGCTSTAPNDANWTAAIAALASETTAKKAFLKDWNPVAGSFGLFASWSADSI